MKESIIPFYPSNDEIVMKSVGCYQYDSNGKEYIDFESGVWCTNLGHSHDRIVRVFEHQSRQSIHNGLRFRNPYSEELSIELQRIIGFDNGASVFLSSGSEAVNLSISIAQKLTGKKKILKIDNSYLSAYGFGQMKHDNEFHEIVNYNEIESLGRIDFTDISAFVMETGGASVDMVRFPNSKFINELVSVTKQHKCLVIANEVTTGIGRLGRWFGFQEFQIKPDIVVTGKALGNGYPVSAVTINALVSEKLNNDIFRYAQSHQNDPFGCAVGLEVIKVIEAENLINNCIVIGEYFKTELTRLQRKHPNSIKEIRAKGLMLAAELYDSFDGNHLNKYLFEKGFVVGFKQNTLRFLPPLTITEKEINKFILALKELL